MALPLRRPLEAPPPAAVRSPARPALYAHHLPARPIVEVPRRGLPPHLVRELGRLAFIAGVLGGPIAVWLKASS